MTAEFRKNKLLRAFRIFDSDSSGSIDKSDFELVVDKITKAKGWKPSDTKYKEVQDTLMKVWNGISQADKDKDGQVSAGEWIQMWDDYAKNPSNPLEWQSVYSKFFFWLQDGSNDGAIDKDEFAATMSSFAEVSKAEAESAFDKLSKGKGKVTWAEFEQLWKEYFTSEDANAAGNFIFVKYQ